MKKKEKVQNSNLNEPMSEEIISKEISEHFKSLESSDRIRNTELDLPKEVDLDLGPSKKDDSIIAEEL